MTLFPILSKKIIKYIQLPHQTNQSMGTACVFSPWVDWFLWNDVKPQAVATPSHPTPLPHGAPSLTSLLFYLLSHQGSLNPLVNLPCASCSPGGSNEVPWRTVSLPSSPTHCCSQLSSPKYLSWLFLVLQTQAAANGLPPGT